MSEFSKGGVLEAEQLYRGKRKYFGFDLRSAAISSPPRATTFATVLLRSATPNRGLSASHSAQLSIVSVPALVRIARNAREEMR